MSSLTRNIVKDFGGVPDGTTNNNAAFAAFRVWGRLQRESINLIVPAGRYVIDGPANDGIFNGIKQLSVSAYGASFLQTPYFIGIAGFRQEAGFSARVNTICVGDTTADLKTPSQISRFFVGAWCCLGAHETQGPRGYPPNLSLMQFVRITAINAVTGMVSFSPAAINKYSDQFQETNPGQAYDTGGPATLFLMLDKQGVVPQDTWGAQVAIAGLTIVNGAGGLGSQIYAPCRSITYTDCKFVGCAPVPTANQSFLAIRCTTDAVIVENDKCCEHVEFRDCNLHAMTTQSSSIQNLTIDRTIIRDFCNGIARRTVIKGKSILPNLIFNPIGYGNAETLIVEAPAHIEEISVTARGSQQSNFTNVTGNLTYTPPNILPWGVPNAKLYISGSSLPFGRYTAAITGETSAENKKVLITTFPDPLPPLPAQMGAPFFIAQHPCASVTVRAGVTGSDDLVALTRPEAQGLPIRSYNYRIGSNFNPSVNMPIWGKLKFLRVNVIRADTGPQESAFLQIGDVFNNAAVIKDDGVFDIFGPIINIKRAGLRIITPTTVTGGQSGDTLPAPPGQISFCNSIDPFMSGNMSEYTAEQRPLIEIEILTEQF